MLVVFVFIIVRHVAGFPLRGNSVCALAMALIINSPNITISFFMSFPFMLCREYPIPVKFKISVKVEIDSKILCGEPEIS